MAYVPVDFDAPDFAISLTAALRQRGFRTGDGALFVWEGVIGYIDDAKPKLPPRRESSLGSSRASRASRATRPVRPHWPHWPYLG